MPSAVWSGIRIRLRPGQAEDIEFLARARLDDHDAMRMHGEGFVPPPPSRRELIGEFAEPAEQPVCRGDERNFVVARIEDDLPVGTASVPRTRPQAGWFLLAITIFEAHRRKGFGSDAVRVLLRGYFDELRYHKANAAVFSTNTASLALFRHLGFVEEGCLRETRFTEGRHVDEHLFGITAPEFRARAASD